MSIVFDKLAFLRRLEGAEMPRNQAEALSEAFHQAVSETVASKQDIDLLRKDVDLLRKDVDSQLHLLRKDVDTQGGSLRAELSVQVAQLKVWTVYVGVASVLTLSGVIFAAAKLVK